MASDRGRKGVSFQQGVLLVVGIVLALAIALFAAGLTDRLFMDQIAGGVAALMDSLLGSGGGGG